MTNKKTPICPACGTETERLFSAEDENQRISGESFRYRRCRACGFIHLENVPHDLARYYGQGYYKFPSLDALKAAAAKDRAKLPAVWRFVKQGRLLEVGPAFGIFACAAKQAGFAVEAIEIDPACCQYLRDTLGVTVHQSANPHQVVGGIEGEFDVITAWQVIEHLPDPMAFIDVASKKLKPGGILAISTPNPDAFQFKVMKSHWPHVDAPRHVTLIPHKVIEERATRHGLATIFFDDDDADARIWNRFGWQVLLMNRLRGRWPKAAGFVLGTLIGLLLSPFDRRAGSAYTLVMQKRETA